MLRAVLAVFLVTAHCVASSKGGSNTGAHGGTVHVSGYAKKDGTVVQAYDRSAPGTAIHYDALSGSMSTAEGLESEGGAFSAASVAGNATKSHAVIPVCEYKTVMTDDEIDICKHTARGD